MVLQKCFVYDLLQVLLKPNSFTVLHNMVISSRVSGERYWALWSLLYSQNIRLHLFQPFSDTIMAKRNTNLEKNQRERGTGQKSESIDVTIVDLVIAVIHIEKGLYSWKILVMVKS